MYSTSPREILHGYSVIRASLDDHHDHAVPRRRRRVATRRPGGTVGGDLETDETVRGIDDTSRKLMGIVRNQIQRWANARKVP